MDIEIDMDTDIDRASSFEFRVSGFGFLRRAFKIRSLYSMYIFVLYFCIINYYI